MRWLLISLCLLAACSRAQTNDRVHHVVFCWLKDAGNSEQRALLIETSRAFIDIPGVVNVRAGTAVLSERPIVDDSFDVGIYLSFRSVLEMQDYLNNPQHQQAIKNSLQPFVSKILVYDFIE